MAESSAKKKKQKKTPVLTKTPVWQALAVLSWAKEILITEILPRDSSKVCEFSCKVRPGWSCRLDFLCSLGSRAVWT